jgi:NAD(P)H dehydrogenase (quinone)
MEFPVPSKSDGLKVLIVTSHPSSDQSYLAQLVTAAKDVLETDGHAVFVDDLVAIGFNPVPGRHDFVSTFNADKLDLQDEQKFAARGGGSFAPDLQAQMDMMVWCDVVIHVFPLHWWSLPAMHKGWVDRVMAYHWCYGTVNAYMHYTPR